MRLIFDLFAASTVVYFMLGAWVVAIYNENSQRLYGILCFTTALWETVWAILFAGIDPEWNMFWIRFCYTGIVFIPSVLYQFIAEFTERRSVELTRIRIAYVLSAVFSIAIWHGSLFVAGVNKFSWGLAAKRGALHPFFAIMVAFVIGRVWILLADRQRDINVSELKKSQISWVRIATIVYCGGALDLLSNYGVSLFPLSPLFLGAAFVIFNYAVFKYDFLSTTPSLGLEGVLARRHAASSELMRMGMSAAFPLVSQGELLGYLLLGEKMSEESYSKEDLLLLRIVANQAALGYQRVRYLEMAVYGARTEMLGEIAGGFAHEIKTPLANISLPAELSILDLDDVKAGRKRFDEILPELQTRLKDIMSQTVKASEKIEAVRQFSKPGQVRLEAVQLSYILENSLGLLSHLLTKSGVIISADFATDLSPIRADAKQLEIVFTNLIKNAAEAMAGNPSSALARDLRIGAKEDGDWVVISVKDSGPGIKQTDVGHMFEAYFTTKGSTGTGMGLFLSQQVIKAHGGSIHVSSVEGQGTEFVIRLPKAKSSDVASTSSSGPDRSVAA